MYHMATIFEVSDYIIFRLKSEGDVDLNTLKHQKLLYYVQAWFLAFNGKKMFNGDFQAWLHGPVNRDIYDYYKDKKYLYSEISIKDITNISNIEKLSTDDKLHIDTILESYAVFSSTQLEHMTHNEKPWIEARNGYEPYQRCEEIINPETMIAYYANRLNK